jgi:nitrate/TMAO reductase-like tetraheme cytochrome c subunit
MKKLFPKTFYNITSLYGLSVVAISFVLFIFLSILDFFATDQKPYMGIITFIILPAFLIIGLAIGFLGIWREHKRKKLGLPVHEQLPRIDLNDPKQQRVVLFTGIGTLVFLFLTVFGSYKAYEYTDSDAFCGTMCHKVMDPEYTAYQSSPHARVGCAKCHIGPGAGWYVRSKLSGAYQVYATVFNKYPEPIPTPIENLRPAQETCEQCHWPKQFFSEKLKKNTYFLSDEKNTRWTLDLLLKIGGGNIEAGPASGIHWHMNIANELSYIATDTQRQVIPWIKSKRSDGSVVVYRTTENSISDSAVQTMKKRRMDCIDCHNRPTHIYNPPARSVNHSMTLGWIDPALPGVKSAAVKALETSYATKMEGLEGIRRTLEDYYQTNYPQIASTNNDTLARAIKEVQRIFDHNYFPEMKVSWRKFPDNLGHLYSPGCFRCHDGKHVAGDGKILSRDCNVCHTILAQQFEKEGLRLSLDGIEYRHPVDIGTAWKEMNCSDCHNAQ